MRSEIDTDVLSVPLLVVIFNRKAIPNMFYNTTHNGPIHLFGPFQPWSNQPRVSIDRFQVDAGDVDHCIAQLWSVALSARISGIALRSLKPFP